MVLTEDLGKTFEYAICMVYGIPYAGPFRYSIVEASALRDRLTALPTLFPACTHTAARGARYDYTSLDGGVHLSAKTSKRRGAKVAPQVVGQATPEKFCSELGIEFVDVPTLKRYIQEHIVEILPTLVQHTFDCPNLYYNKETESIKFIQLTRPIDWSVFEMTWTRGWGDWNNSSTLKVNGQSVLEVQFHSAGRSNMAVRWCYDTVLEVFSDNFTVHSL
jgi:hypothetical protein